MVGESRNELRIGCQTTKEVTKLGNLRFLQASLQILRRLVNVSIPWNKPQPFGRRQHVLVKEDDVTSQNFVQDKVTYEWRDIWNFLQCFDSLLQRLTSKFLEIVGIRCFEDVSQDRTNSQALPIRSIEGPQH